MTKAQAGHLLDEIAAIRDLAVAQPVFKARAGFDADGRRAMRHVAAEATQHVAFGTDTSSDRSDAFDYFVEVEVDRAARGATGAHVLRLLALAAEFQIDSLFTGDLILLR